MDKSIKLRRRYNRRGYNCSNPFKPKLPNTPHTYNAYNKPMRAKSKCRLLIKNILIKKI